MPLKTLTALAVSVDSPWNVQQVHTVDAIDPNILTQTSRPPGPVLPHTPEHGTQHHWSRITAYSSMPPPQMCKGFHLFFLLFLLFYWGFVAL